MNLQGKIYKIFDTIQVSEKFSKREFVLDCQSNNGYPQYIKMEFIQNNCSILDKYKVGDSVNVEFDIKGREWQNPEGKFVYFVTLQAWKMQKTNGASYEEDDTSPAELKPPEFSDDPDSEETPF